MNVLRYYLTQGEEKRGEAKLATVPPDLMVSYETVLSLPSQNESHCSVANVCLLEITINTTLNNFFLPHASMWLS